ncbi:peroxisomal 2,4-dienoyl-CoA reductase isoform X2 [Nomascus leucogenys]|uniref:peroxisomal 2,4-dienoyl-CoA reductase isoform X2 n=1 Tax=Nomascus leucogenys TaxID=61853 RepID=UPI00122DB375|nr:peroxisomal 2,4-dienoyl-CoA reductase isoform X2 [Nomascus leucogenys]
MWAQQAAGRCVGWASVAHSCLCTWCLGQDPPACAVGCPMPETPGWAPPEVPPEFLSPANAPVPSASRAFSPGLVLPPERLLPRSWADAPGSAPCPHCPHTCFWFCRHGCHTVIASRSLPRVLTAARKLAGATGRHCLPLSMDVRAPPDVMAAVDQALKEFGRIDILINCAAGNFLCPAGALSFNAFKTVMDIDTSGTFNVSRVLYEKFFRDHGGVIVNITATLGNRGQALQVHAGSAKAAVDAMTRHLAVEWGPQNIRVNSLAPGPISGTEGLRRLGGPQASLSTKVTASPLQRLGNKTEIAHSVLYLASPLASYVTGAVLVADGGAWLTFPNDVKGLADFASFSAKL